MSSGPFNELPDWPDVTETLEALFAMYQRGHRRNPRALNHVRPIMMRGNVRPSDREILNFLASLAITLPAVLAVCPEWRDQPTMRKALATISALRESRARAERHAMIRHASGRERIRHGRKGVSMTRFRTTIPTLATVALLTACGGGGGDPETSGDGHAATGERRSRD